MMVHKADGGFAVPGEGRESFGERVRRLRQEGGHNIADTAMAVGVSEGAIRQLETGNVKSPSFLVGLRLADYLHVDPFYLAMGDGASLTDHLELLDRRMSRVEKANERLEAVERRLGLRR